MLCKSLWIKASAKCINLNVNDSMWNSFLLVFHISDQQVATLTGGNVMLWPRSLRPVLSNPSLLRVITVKCVHR